MKMSNTIAANFSKLIVSAICLAAIFCSIGAIIIDAQSISGTAHNLGNTGPGPIKASTESRICVFCHAPHRTGGSAPLWNREDSRATYIVYNSPSLQASLGQPTGSSRLCLSCHDGTIALGAIVSDTNQIQFQGGTVFLPPGHSLLEADLSDDHPISFTYDNALALSDQELVLPDNIPANIPLDHAGRMQCSSCHDAHTNDFGKFLRESPLFSQLCVGCHSKNGWSGSAHDIANNSWNGTGIDPWPHTEGLTVAENGCMSCHQAHEAGNPIHLVNSVQEENNCLNCHNGNIGIDINSTIGLISSHPVAFTTGVHLKGEDPAVMPRHVECSDCHNPHAVTLDNPPPPALNGALRLVDGIDINGNPVAAVTNSYEVCFKCHGDNAGATSVVTRLIQNLNTRQEFNPTAISFHPVVSIGKSNDVPSLLPPLTETSQIACEDCHSSPSGSAAGPHGSQYSPILKLNYSTTDFTQESSQAYALCYSCHDRSSILDNDSFKHHKKHISSKDTPCSVCHDPHGISSAGGNATNNSHLINFDLTVVNPDPNTGKLEFVDKGVRRGECFLECHGKKHSPKGY